jgi:hypothetical protein
MNNNFYIIYILNQLLFNIDYIKIRTYLKNDSKAKVN